LNDLSIPLRLSSDITIPTERSTVKDTYNQIIKDLMKAKDLLPDMPLYKTRGSRAGAFALLARVYLVMDKYDSSLVYANESLKLYDTLLDYSKCSTTANFIGLFNDEVLYHTRFLSSIYSSLTSSLCVDTLLYKLYSDNDFRKVIFF